MFICDAGTIASSGFLLWVSAGTTVLNGNTSTLTLAFILSAVLITGRSILGRRLAAASGTLAPVLVAVANAVLTVGALTAAYTITGEYFLGWLTALAAALAAVSAIVSLLLSLLGTGGSISLLYLVPAAIGIAGFIPTQQVWADNGVLTGLILFVGGFILCGQFFHLIVQVAAPTPGSRTDDNAADSGAQR